MNRTAATLGGIVVAGAGALAWSVVEARWFTLREVTVPVLDAGSAPVRVLHISDLHLVPSQRRKIDWVRDLDTLAPDLVVDTGDNMAHLDALPAVLEALEPLLARPGVFAMGSNDYYEPSAKNPARYLQNKSHLGSSRVQPHSLPADELATAMRSAGWRDVNNRRDSLTTGGTRFTLVGTDDAHLHRDVFPAAEPGNPPPDGATSGGSGGIHLGVTHAPYLRVLESMRQDGAQLVMAGHTHGGQLALPFYGALVTNCDLDGRRAKGLHGWPGARPDEVGGEESTWLHVSAGLGTSPYTPVRFSCRPEATLLTLVPRVAARS